MLRPPSSVLRITPLVIKSCISRNAVSGEHLVIFPHLEEVSFPSKPSQNKFTILICRSFIETKRWLSQKAAFCKIVLIDFSVSSNAASRQSRNQCIKHCTIFQIKTEHTHFADKLTLQTLCCQRLLSELAHCLYTYISSIERHIASILYLGITFSLRCFTLLSNNSGLNSFRWRLTSATTALFFSVFRATMSNSY